MSKNRAKNTAKNTVEELEKVKAWLGAHDKDLWSRKINIASARILCSRSVGFTVPYPMFKAARKEVCEYWQKKTCRKYSQEVSLSTDQWYQVRYGWCSMPSRSRRRLRWPL